LDAVLEEHLKEITGLKKQELFHQFISLSTSGGKYQVSCSSAARLRQGLLDSVRQKFLLSSLFETSKS
jgi:U3 small nucleolar RNA-associated protein 10